MLDVYPQFPYLSAFFLNYSPSGGRPPFLHPGPLYQLIFPLCHRPGVHFAMGEAKHSRVDRVVLRARHVLHVHLPSVVSPCGYAAQVQCKPSLCTTAARLSLRR